MRIEDDIISIPTWDNGTWTHTEFNGKEEFRIFLESIFKEPGKYGFDKTTLLFNEQARNFKKQDGRYCLSVKSSKDYRDYWDKEKEKSTKGVIFKNKDKVWYLTRGYYFWINFLKIKDKIKGTIDFPEVWDTHYHMALYETIAYYNGKHCVMTKKRQIGASYFHCAILINRIWFDEGTVLKIGASLKSYIDYSGDWRFLDEYRDFLNTNTAWYRPMNPGKELNWQQKVEVFEAGRKRVKGLKGTLTGMTFESKVTRGVGGNVDVFLYDEAGIAPNLNKVMTFVSPALKMGSIVTGQFIATGSVGELSDAEPLKAMMKSPDDYGIQAVTTDLIDETHARGERALFIPEQWSMPPYIDEYGNSLVKEALEYLDELFETYRKTKSPSEYQYEVSQHPRYLSEAYAYREEAFFPLNLIEEQSTKIKEKFFPCDYVDMEEANGKIVIKRSRKIPVSEFPVKKNAQDKDGVICMYEKYDENASYVASIDPVAVGKTDQSVSLVSIYVYKKKMLVTKHMTDGKTQTYLEQGKIVCSWAGRFDELGKSHNRLRLIQEYYHARAIVESNISNYITYMIGLNKQHLLIRKTELVFVKESIANITTGQEYGWRNVGTFFHGTLLNYLLEFINETLDEEIDDAGKVLTCHKGIERIPDIMAMKEMADYRKGLNVDRLISLAALAAYIIKQESEEGVKKKEIDENEKSLQNTEKIVKLDRGAFHRTNHGMATMKKKLFRSIR